MHPVYLLYSPMFSLPPATHGGLPNRDFGLTVREKVHSQQAIHECARRQRMGSHLKALHPLPQAVQPGNGYHGCDDHSIGRNHPHPAQRAMRLTSNSFQHLHWKNREAGTRIHQQPQHHHATIRATNRCSQQEQVTLSVQAIAATDAHRTTARSSGTSPRYSTAIRCPRRVKSCRYSSSLSGE